MFYFKPCCTLIVLYPFPKGSRICEISSHTQLDRELFEWRRKKIFSISAMLTYCFITLQFKNQWKVTERQADSNFTQALAVWEACYTIVNKRSLSSVFKMWRSTAEQKAHSKCILWLLQLQIEFWGMTWLKTPNNPTSLAVPELNKVTLYSE